MLCLQLPVTRQIARLRMMAHGVMSLVLVTALSGESFISDETYVSLVRLFFSCDENVSVVKLVSPCWKLFTL